MKNKTPKSFLEKIKSLTFGFGHNSSSEKPPQIGDTMTCGECGKSGTVIGMIEMKRTKAQPKEDESTSFAA